MISGSAPRIAGESCGRVPLVVGLVVRPVRRVELGDPGLDLGQRRARRQVEHHRLDLGPQEVVGAARAELGQPRVVAGGQEVEHDRVVGEVPDHRPVLRRHAPQQGRELGGPGPTLCGSQRLELLQPRSERVLLGVLLDVALGGADHPQGVPLASLGGVAPGRDAVAAEDAADGLRVLRLDGSDVEAELEAGPAPRHPHDLVAEDPLRQRLAVGGRRDRDPGVGVQVVDVRRVHEPVHGGVDRGSRTALAVQAVVEGRDHLVLALDARVDVHEGTHPVESQDRETALGEGAEVAAGSLDPEQLDVLTRHRVGLGALGGGVAAGVVGVLRVGAEPVGPGDELRCC